MALLISGIIPFVIGALNMGLASDIVAIWLKVCGLNPF
jgi:hypothetical protein